MHSSELTHLTKSAILERNDDSSLAAQFLRSAAYSGVEAPARALAQVADQVGRKVTGGQADSTVQAAFKSIGVEQPKPAEFGTSQWMVQQVGGAAGMMLPFLAVRSGLKFGAAQAFGEQALTGTLEAGTQSLAQTAMREAALSGTTGLIYGSLLSPSKESNVGTSSFYADRLKNGLSDMATFGALSAMSPFVSKGIESFASATEASSLLPAAAKTSLAAAMRFPLISGMVAGVPSGLVSAEASALKDGKLLPSGEQVKESVAGMAIVGGVMSSAQWAIERAVSSPQDRAAEVQQQVIQDLKEQVEAQLRGNNSQQMEPIFERRAQASQAQVAPQDGAKDGMLEDLVGNAVRRMNEQKQGRAAAVTPEENLLEAMAKSTIKGGGTTKPVEDEAAARSAKPANPNLTNAESNLPGLEIVLGASGSETTAHVGFLQAIEDNHVPVGRITGVSGGSLVATLYANHYSPAEIKNILMGDNFRQPSLSVLAQCFHLTDPWNLFPYAMDFKPWLKDFVDTYKLKPQENLRIVAADQQTHAPITFEGTNYDLTTALAASTAATPALGLKPVEVNGRTAIDGFYYHPIPAALSKAPALVSKIGFVKDLPSSPLAPWDYFLHLKERAYYKELSGRYPDPEGHIIAQTGLSDVATTTFGLSTETLEKLIDHGYQATTERLQQPDAVKAIEEARIEVAAAKKK